MKVQYTNNIWTLDCILNARGGTLTSPTWLPLTRVFYRLSNPLIGGFRIFHYIKKLKWSVDLIWWSHMWKTDNTWWLCIYAIQNLYIYMHATITNIKHSLIINIENYIIDICIICEHIIWQRFHSSNYISLKNELFYYQ